jgi:ethanolamine transporter EutH
MKRAGLILVITSWVVFIASWAMPAAQFQDMEPYMGWMAGWAVIKKIPDFYLDWPGFFVAILGIGNIVAAIAPAALFFSTKPLLRFMSVFSMVVFIIALGMYFDGDGFVEGYFMWVASFLGAAIGFGLLSAAVPRDKSPRQTG